MEDLVSIEDEIFQTFCQRGKAFGLEGEKLLEYVDKNLKERQERQDRIDKRKEEAELVKEEAELVMRKEEAELIRQREKEEAELIRQREKEEAEIRKLELQLESQRITQTAGQKNESHTIKPTIPRLPIFKEKIDDIDSYLFRFESHAINLKWPKDQWTTFLSALLEGTALNLYHSLSEGGAVGYEVLKEHLLKKFQCTPDGFRKRFRESRPVLGEPFETYAVELRRLFDRWVSLSDVPKTYDGLVDLILTEQLVESVSKDLVTFLCEKDEHKFNNMISSAESYRRAHPTKTLARKGEISLFASVAKFKQTTGSFENTGYRPGNESKSRSSFRFRPGGDSRDFGHGTRYGSSYDTYRGRHAGGRGAYMNQSSGGNNASANFSCFLCGKTGHKAVTCSWKSRKDPCPVCALSHPRGSCPFKRTQVKDPTISPELKSTEYQSSASVVVCSITEQFAGQLHLESGVVNNATCSVLRDTGATVCGVRNRLVRKDQFLGQSVKCVSFGGRIEEFPLARVEVQSQYISGPITCCVLESPVADLIVGNIPGVTKVVSSAESESLFSMAAITRARSKHVVDKKALSELASVLDITPEMLIHKQEEDVSLKQCFQLAASGEVRRAGATSQYFHIVDGILYRSYEKGSRTWEQVVVPSSLRSSVLAVSHDLILAGHCGARRTLNRLREKFFWPGVTIDVSKYVASCDVCQRTIPKGKVLPVPLNAMPVIGTPFHRVAIDLVGPLSPASEKGHRYILTLIDVATRYPEAVPMKDISSISVAEALFGIFSRLGFPKEILSDQGTQFNSDLMKQFHALCGCQGIRTSPYHPQANGTVERFHGTLKAMLRKIIRNQPKQWHRYLPALLFACRELPSESTGFSPFMLLFGREVRGPISLLQESWTGKDGTDEEAKPLYRYLFELKNIIFDSCQIAMQNSTASAAKGKRYFDRKTKARSFQIKDEVLVLLPTDTNKLLSSWLGPFPITDTMHPDYRVLVKGKQKIFHANMLKKYLRRDAQSVFPDTSLAVGSTVPWDDISPLTGNFTLQSEVQSTSQISESSGIDFSACSIGVIRDAVDAFALPTLSTPMSTSTPDEDVDDIKFNSSLSETAHYQLKEVFQEFFDILTTKPGCFTDKLYLEISLTSDVPVRRKMYELPFSAKEIIEREVKTMLELGVIEKSKSPYTAPVVLVQKKDGSCRFCIDYRWLNKITQFDAEPIPDVEALFSTLSGAKFFTRIDLTKGYWQICVRPEDRPKTAFATHVGLFQFIRMPFGLVSAPAVFARMMRMLRLETCSSVNFFDDILIHSADWDSHIAHVRAVLQTLRSFGLTARPTKIEAGFRSIEFLGHVVGEGTLRPGVNKVRKILQIPTPTTKKQVRSLLGLISFYRRYVPNFASLSAPLSDLTKDGPRASRLIVWTPECAQALQKIKAVLSANPVLLLPRLHVPFILRTDASSVGLGAVLLQEFDEVLHPIVFASRKLLERECNYSTIERECLAIVWAVRKFVRFLWGVRFVLQTDHRPLTYLRSSSFKNSRILRWALVLQEFSFDIEPISGSSNIFADVLSRAYVDQMIP